MSTGVGCTVYLDGVRFADGSPGDDLDEPTALSGLSIQWGRDTTVDQPDVGTCTFDVMDRQGGDSFLGLLHVGKPVRVTATGTTYPDPTESTFRDPGFETDAWDSTNTNAVAATTTRRHLSGARSLRIDPVATDRTWRVLLPPGEFVPVGTQPDAWDDIPTVSPGQTWSVGASLYVPAGVVVTLRPALWTGPWRGSVNVSPAGAPVQTITGDNAWHTVAMDYLPQTAGAWIGLRVDAWPVSGVRWVDVDPAVTWASLDPGLEPRTNLATNPAATSTATAALPGQWGVKWAGGTGWAASTTFVAGAADGPVPGLATYVRRTWTAVPEGPYSAGAADVGFAWSGATNRLPVQAGHTYTLSRYLRMSVEPGGAYRDQLNAAFRDDANAAVGTAVASPTVAWVAGQWLRQSLTFTAPAGATWVALSDSMQTGANSVLGMTMDQTGLLIEEAGALGDYFDGDTPDTPAIAYDWNGTRNASTSGATPVGVDVVQWADLGAVFVDDVAVLAPAGGTAETVVVFDGRISDLAASYDENDQIQGPVVKVTAVDFTADLENVNVGDDPWPEQPLSTRFARVLTLSGQDVAAVIDARPQAVTLCYQDVDSQQVVGLLQDFATSADGVLWAAVHATTGPYLWLEDPRTRTALATLEMGDDGLVHIVSGGGANGNDQDRVDLSACWVLRDPVTWTQDVADVFTRAAVTWNEYVPPDPEEEGSQASTTEHTTTVVDPVLEATYGVRREQVTTLLAFERDAEDVATSILARTSSTDWRVSGVTVDDRVMSGEAEQTHTLLTLLDGTRRIGLPVRITDLPWWSPGGGSNPGYVEGGTYQFNDGLWSCDLSVSSARGQGATPMSWADSLPAWRWVDYAPDIRWTDLAGVNPPTRTAQTNAYEEAPA